MATIPLGIFFGGAIVGIPVVTGVAQGVEEQKKQNAAAANEEYMTKFTLVADSSDEGPGGEINGWGVVVRDERLWLCPLHPDTAQPFSQSSSSPASLPPHPFTGFYITYPDDTRLPPERGLVTTISLDPPMLNWVYINTSPSSTPQLRHGNRTASIAHTVGPWDWTGDKRGVVLEGREGFWGVDLGDGENTGRGAGGGVDGLRWGVFWDKDGDGLRGVRGRKVKIRLERREVSREDVKREEEEVERKLQVNTRGDLKTKWDRGPGT